MRFARGHLWLSVSIITVLLGGSMSGTAWLISSRPQPQLADERDPSLRVRAMRVRPQSITETVTAYGTAQAERYAWISAQVQGTVSELPDIIKPGAWVEAGQPLLLLDDREYRQQIQRAQSLVRAERAKLAQLGVREASLQRLIHISEGEVEIGEREHVQVSQLFAQGASNQRELDLKRLARENARARLFELENERDLLPSLREEAGGLVALREAEQALAELNLSRTRIAAPFSGRIDQVLVVAGEQVVPGQRVLAMLDPHRIEIPLQLPVSYRGRVVSGAACRLNIESRPEVVWLGQVDRISPSAQTATRTFTLFVDVDVRAGAPLLVPGMLVRAQIDGLRHEAALVIPRHCLRDGRAFVHESDQARSRSVRVVAALQDQVIVEGLNADHTVITSNLDALFDGMAVEIAGYDTHEVAAAAVLQVGGLLP